MLGHCPDAPSPREIGDHSYFAYLVVDDVDDLHADLVEKGAIVLQALVALLVAVQDNPAYPFPQRVLASCYTQMGRLDDAREVLTRLRTITPVVIPDVDFLRNPEHRDLLLSGLRIAMGEAK